MNNTKRLKKLIISLTIIIITITGAIFVISEKQNIDDYISLLNYKPSSEIASIVIQDGMTPYTKKVFYVNHPQIDSKSVFAKECPNNSETIVVLGCYHPYQKGIFLLNVTNKQLYGLVQVTAAYETLHAIYQRLNTYQKNKLDKELLNYEKNDLKNQVIIAQINNFKKTEPGHVLNEMTSLFGTEVPSLPKGLSAFYHQYFNNRKVLFNFYSDYQNSFTSRENEIKSYDNQLTSLKNTINSDENQLNSLKSGINNLQNTLNNYRTQNQVYSYNSLVPQYNNLVSSYNNLAHSVLTLINQYNQIIIKRNSVVLTEQQLTQAITTIPKPIKSD